ncbi:MAG: GTP cyclohydrolase I [Myxococcota bacterium]|nr:GTP cyclohydrolase I [Myxococcota bacterium]
MGVLGFDIKDDNFADTAARAAKGFHELVHDQTQAKAEIEALLAKTFSAKYTEMVISKHNTAFGICPHHLLPVIYRISLAYIPTAKVLGLSKLSRLARLIARGPRLQEDLTHELADIMHDQLQSQGSAVYIEGLHMCMAARGVGAHEARLVTSGVRGVFLELATREEFLKLVLAPPTTLV